MPRVIRYDENERRESRIAEVKDIRIDVQAQGYLAIVTCLNDDLEEWATGRGEISGNDEYEIREIRSFPNTSSNVLDLRSWTCIRRNRILSDHRWPVNENAPLDNINNFANINLSVASENGTNEDNDFDRILDSISDEANGNIDNIRGASNNLRALNDASRMLDGNEINDVGREVLDRELTLTPYNDADIRDIMQLGLIENNRRNTAEFIKEVTKDIKAGNNPFGNEPIKRAISRFRDEFDALDGIDI